MAKILSRFGKDIRDMAEVLQMYGRDMAKIMLDIAKMWLIYG